MKKKLLIALCLILCVSLFTIIIVKTINSSNNDNTTVTDNIIKRHIGLIGFTQEELNEMAIYIVEAEVTKVHKSSIESVVLPLASEVCDSIVTDTELVVKNVIKGDISNNKITVRCNIGTVGDTTLICEQEPSFAEGEKVLLFLCNDEVSDTYRLAGFIYGKYVKTDNGNYMNYYSKLTITPEELVVG